MGSILGGCGRIPLNDRHGKARAWATVDLADFAQLAEHRWYLNDKGYAVRNTPRPLRETRSPHIRMHRVLTGLEDDDPREPDHIDGHPLNNRRANLRIVTHAQNRQNTKGWDDATSRHRGVSWDRARGKWRAQAKLNMRAVFIGRYDDEDAAYAARLAWEAEHMPYATGRA